MNSDAVSFTSVRKTYGAGKTRAIAMALALISPTEGEVRVSGGQAQRVPRAGHHGRRPYSPLRPQYLEEAVRFIIGGDPGTGLDALPNVTGVERHGRTATLTTTDAERTVRALFAARDLEDAVLALTRCPRTETHRRQRLRRRGADHRDPRGAGRRTEAIRTATANGWI
jgi:hypothetical protein